MTVNTKFKAFSLVGLPDLRERPADATAAIDAIIRAAKDARWWSDDGNPRYTILHCIPVGDFGVFGVLAQQHRLERHLYDDAKQQKVEDLDSYEDRYFFIDLRNRSGILEWRQFRTKPPLTLPLMQDRISRVLTSLLRDPLRLELLSLIPIEFETLKGEFLQLFYQNRIIALEATDIGTFSVPEDVQLVNPMPPLEGAMRDLLAHDFGRQSIDSIKAEVADDPQRDLQRSAIARGILHSGTPKQIRYQRPDGAIRVRRQHETGTLEVTVPLPQDASAEEIALVAERVVSTFEGYDLLREHREQIAPPNLDLF